MVLKLIKINVLCYIYKLIIYSFCKQHVHTHIDKIAFLLSFKPLMIGNMLRNGVRRLRCRRFFTSAPNEIVTIENFRNIQLNRLKELKPDQFDKPALYHLIGDFLVKPEKPDLVAAEQLLTTFRSYLPEIDTKGDLVSLYIVQLIESKDESDTQKAVEFVSSLLELQSRSLVSPFIIEFIWENVIKYHASESGQVFYDVCVKHYSLIESCEISTEKTFKERLLLELFLPCRNQAMIDRIVADSVSDGRIGVSASTLLEIFKVFIEPEPEDPYPEPEPFTEAATLPRFHSLVSLLQHWKDLGIPVKGDSVSKALSNIFKKFLPSNSMMKSLESLI